MTATKAEFGAVEKEPLRTRLLRYTTCLGLVMFLFGVVCVAGKVTQIGGLTLPNLEELFLIGLSSAALFYAIRERTTFALTLGIFVWVYCIVMFAGAVTQAADPSDLTVRRLSPNGAMGLASLGLSIALMVRAGRFRIKLLLGAVCAYISAILGLVATWGYFLGVKEAYAWGAGDELSFGLSIWLLIAGALVGHSCQTTLLTRGVKFRGAFGIPAGIATTLGALLIAAALLAHESRQISLSLQQESELTRRLLDLSQKELIATAQQVTVPLEKGKTPQVVSVDVAHPSVKKAFYVRDPNVDVSGSELKDLGSPETLKELLEASGTVASSEPFSATEDIPFMLVSVRRKGEDKNAPRVLMRVAIPELTIPALSWCRDCAAELRRLRKPVVTVGTPYLDSRNASFEHPISFLGAKGWTLDIKPASGFAGNRMDVHPVLVPIAFVVIATLGSLVWWSQIRVTEADSLMKEVARSFGGAQAFREKAAEALDIIRDYVITVDPGERVVYMNRAARHMLTTGSDSELFLGDLYPTHVLANFRKTGFVKARTGQAWATDAMLRDRVGLEFEVDQAIISHMDVDDRPIAYTLIAHDLREDIPQDRPPTIDASEHWERMLREVLSGLPIPMWITDTTRGNVIGVSKELTEVVGPACQDLLIDESAWLENVSGTEQKRIRDEMMKPVSPRGKELKYNVRLPSHQEIPIQHYRLPVSFGENETFRCLIVNLLLPAHGKSSSGRTIPEPPKVVAPTKQEAMLLDFLTSSLGDTAKQVERLVSVMIRDGASRPPDEIREDLELVKDRAGRITGALTEVSELLRIERLKLSAVEFEIGSAIDGAARDVLSQCPNVKLNMSHFVGVTLDKSLVDAALKSLLSFAAAWTRADTSIEIGVAAESEATTVAITVKFDRADTGLHSAANWFLPICPTNRGGMKPGLAVAKAAAQRLGGDVELKESGETSIALRLTIETANSAQAPESKPEGGRPPAPSQLV